MARYLLVQVDDNARAAKLQQKLDAVEGIDVVGMFGKPTKFCECAVRTDDSNRGQTYGFWLCTTCRKPKRGAMQHPFNLLEDGVPSKFLNGFLTIREPYQSAAERTGQDIIDRFKRAIDDNSHKVERARRRRQRAHQRDMQGR